MGCACAINHLGFSLLLSLLTQDVSLSLRPYSLSFTVNDGESLLCNGVGLKRPALPDVEVPNAAVLYSKGCPRMF